MPDESEDMKQPDFRPQGIRFDKTITMGNVLTVVAGLLAMGGAYIDYRVTIDRHETRLSNNEARIIELSARMSEESKARGEMTHALDRLTTILEMQRRPNQP